MVAVAAAKDRGCRELGWPYNWGFVVGKRGELYPAIICSRHWIVVMLMEGEYSKRPCRPLDCIELTAFLVWDFLQGSCIASGRSIY